MHLVIVISAFKYAIKHVHEYTNSFKADLRDQMKLIHAKISPDKRSEQIEAG